MKRILLGLAMLAFVIFLCSRVEAQEGPHIIFDESMDSVTVSTYSNTQRFNISDNISIESDLSVLPLEGNIVNIQIRITKPETDDYFIYELKDPENKLTSILDRVSFNTPPMAIKDGELAWRVAGDMTELLIEGTVEPAAPLYIENNDTWWEDNSTLSIAPADFEQVGRKPRVAERVSLGIKDRINILRDTVGFKQIAIFGFIFCALAGLMVWYYRKRNTLHDKIITTQLNKHETL